MKKQAFTLVELIVVITILAILGTIAFISLQGYSSQSRDSVRINDVGVMKTSLGLYYLDAGKYPIADDFSVVEYDGELLRKQGFFGENVTKNVSRNLSEVPLDPLTEKRYIYSSTSNRGEYQILSLMENDNFTLNKITKQINAEGKIQVTAKLDGEYNGIFVKSKNYIVPTPSIINSEVSTGTLILDSINIKSQINHRGKNIPNYGNIVSNSRDLNITLSVYTGSISKNSTEQQKIDAMKSIQIAFTGSEIVNEGKIKEILNTSDNNLANLTNVIVLGDSTINTQGDSTSILTTITCLDKSPGTTFELNGETYYVASNMTDIQNNIDGTIDGSSFSGNYPANRICTSHVTDMNNLFSDATYFNQALNNWDVSNVTDMANMFNRAENFNQALNNWDVSNVTDMYHMFEVATNFNQDLNNWNVSNVNKMYNMFAWAENFNQALNNWDVSNATDMDNMFYYATSFNQDISGWDTLNVISSSDFDTGSPIDGTTKSPFN